jgi:hypothetical protein
VAASSSAFLRTWLYTAIIAGETCPNCARITQSATPFSASPRQRCMAAVMEADMRQACRLP